MMLLILFPGLVLVTAIVGYLLSSAPYRGSITDHFNGKHFLNFEKSRMPGPRDMIRFMTGGPREKWPSAIASAAGQKKHEGNRDSIRYLGHAMFLITLGGRTILLDPVFRKAGPLGIFGPARFRKPGLALHDLPKIDLILVSHNHYDHFDVSAVKYLISRYSPRLLMPLGCGNALPASFRKNLTELDWWDSLEAVERIKISAVPARHFSGRGLFDRNRSLWCGFVIEYSGSVIYYAGDTAYGKHFAAIARRFPGIDSALLPIGAYRPEWMMEGIHISPADAVQAFSQLGAGKFVAYHHRTFRLSWEGPDTPERELYAASNARNIPEHRILAPREGEVVLMKTDASSAE